MSVNRHYLQVLLIRTGRLNYSVALHGEDTGYPACQLPNQTRKQVSVNINSDTNMHLILLLYNVGVIRQYTL